VLLSSEICESTTWYCTETTCKAISSHEKQFTTMLKRNKRVQQVHLSACSARSVTLQLQLCLLSKDLHMCTCVTNTYSKRQGTNHAHEDVVLGFGVNCHIQLLHTQ
jgi:hypothetical protein